MYCMWSTQSQKVFEPGWTEIWYFTLCKIERSVSRIIFASLFCKPWRTFWLVCAVRYFRSWLFDFHFYVWHSIQICRPFRNWLLLLFLILSSLGISFLVVYTVVSVEKSNLGCKSLSLSLIILMHWSFLYIRSDKTGNMFPMQPARPRTTFSLLHPPTFVLVLFQTCLFGWNLFSCCQAFFFIQSI